jgi:hypothetical protein
LVYFEKNKFIERVSVTRILCSKTAWDWHSAMIAAWAMARAGASLDLDTELEAAGIEHLMKTGKKPA